MKAFHSRKRKTDDGTESALKRRLEVSFEHDELHAQKKEEMTQQQKRDAENKMYKEDGRQQKEQQKKEMNARKREREREESTVSHAAQIHVLSSRDDIHSRHVEIADGTEDTLHGIQGLLAELGSFVVCAEW